MAVNRRQIQALHVVERNWRIDEESEESRADEIPERNCDEEVDWPLVVGNPARLPRWASEAKILPCLESDQGQRHNFKSTEHRTQSDNGRAGASEVQVMEGSNDAARQEDYCGEHHRARRTANLKQLEPCEEERDHNGCEYFEESFDPEVNNPPAPVLSRYKVAALPIHQARSVEG